MTKSKIERARSALITAKQSKIKTFYRNQQNLHDENLTKRMSIFIERVKNFTKEQKEHA